MSPIVSVLIANFNGGDYVSDALASAARQSLRDIEIIFVDDASTDDSLVIAREFARGDDRVRIVSLETNSGPSAARNAGLAAAKGRWVAILDSDDFIHPDRLARLVDEAQRSGAQICADDLIVFQEGRKAESFLGVAETAPRWVTTTEFVASNQVFGSKPPLGYLKPLIDLAFLRRHGLSYRPSLRIGEDYDLLLQLLVQGARYRLTGEPGYFYRKHASSISHRIAVADVERLLEVDAAMRQSLVDPPQSLVQAWDSRRRSLKRALAYSHLIDALKKRQWSRVRQVVGEHPGVLPLLRMPLTAKLKRLLSKPARTQPTAIAKQVCLIARQRLVGNTNGSSTYLLSLGEALRSRGYRISLICPSPATFGRWPALYLRPEMQVFDQILMRGSVRVGRRLFVAKDPRILVSAALTVAEKLLLRLRILGRSRVKPAPYAVAVPWSKQDQLFVAQHAPPSSRIVIADYAFVAPAIPYAMCPKAQSLVVMHDLFCSRTDQFASASASDSVASIDEATELALLGAADVIVAIQENEARFVAERLPQRRVIVAPMATDTVDDAQPGDGRTVLFVGSSTAPNVVGLRWFLDSVWPQLKRDRPDCELLVAGRVQQAFHEARTGVHFLGMVDDLEPLYRRAAVVISPLIVGSGLKIKLIEALGRGKAVVATSVTVDGVADQVRSAVTIADDATDFGAAVSRLLSDDRLRLQQCREALQVAKRSFSAEACYADLLNYLEDSAREPNEAANPNASIAMSVPAGQTRRGSSGS
jgi:succinoglycan biosynthesis protein ExoO